MGTVGLLLVSALMVVPVATSQQLTRSFRTTLLAAMVLGAAASVGGLVLSAYLSFHATVAPGPTIVLLSLAGFAVTWPVGAWGRRRARLREPFASGPAPEHEPTEHVHQHGPECGHVAVRHGDHVDYVHDGPRHAVHGAPYDEHGRAHAADQAAAGRGPGHGVLRGLPLGPGHPRPARPARRARGPRHRLPDPAAVGGRRRGRRAAHRGRRGDLPALLRHPPPPPRLPRLRADGRGGGAAREALDPGDRRRARVLRGQPT